MGVGCVGGVGPGGLPGSTARDELRDRAFLAGALSRAGGPHFGRRRSPQRIPTLAAAGGH